MEHGNAALGAKDASQRSEQWISRSLRRAIPAKLVAGAGIYTLTGGAVLFSIVASEPFIRENAPAVAGLSPSTVPSLVTVAPAPLPATATVSIAAAVPPPQAFVREPQPAAIELEA